MELLWFVWECCLEARAQSKQARRRRVGRREGRKEASGQLPSSNSFKFPLEEGRKDVGRKRAAADAEARREGRIRFAAEKIHIKGAMRSRERGTAADCGFWVCGGTDSYFSTCMYIIH